MTYVLTKTCLYVAQYDLTADHFSHTLSWSEDDVENTRMSVAGTAARSYLSGLESWQVSHQGYLDEGGDGGPTDVPWTGKGSAQTITIGPDGAALGDVAYVGQRLVGTLELITGSVGDMAAMSLNGRGTGYLAKGNFLLGETAISATADAAGVNVGPVTAAEDAYAALHVVAVSGSPTLDMVIQSDADDNWLSPTNRITFTQATGLTSEYKSFTAGTSDDWWRASYTFGGTGTISAVVSFGITNAEAGE